jgi:hypothetical protein
MADALFCVVTLVGMVMAYLLYSAGKRVLDSFRRYFPDNPRSILGKWISPRRIFDPWVIRFTWEVGGLAFGVLLSSMVITLYRAASIHITLWWVLGYVGIVAGVLLFTPMFAGTGFEGELLTDYVLGAGGMLLGCVAFVLRLLPGILRGGP